MDWINDSKKIKDLEVEICFLLQKNFFTNNPREAAVSVALEPPAFDHVADTLARTREVLTHENELASYYKRIVEKGASLGWCFDEIRLYFELRLWFWNIEEDVHIGFPWYHTLSDMQKLFACIRKGAEYDAYVDIDSGWQIHVLRAGDYLHFRQIDEEYLNVAVPYEPVAKAVGEVYARATGIIAHLTQSLGADVWTRHIQEAGFGTSEWRPG